MSLKNKKDKNTNKKTSIGGQAVMEGVMMRGKTAMATAVRDEDGIIRIETQRIKPPEKQSIIARLPIIRGCVNFVTSMVSGMKTLTRSAEVYGEAEPSKFEKWVSKKLKINIMSIVITFSTILGILLAVGLFVIAPIGARMLIEKLIGNGYKFELVAKNFIEGGFKILIFILYILLVSLLKDIRRVFMYHGAEHKTISCYEKGLDLTPANAQSCSRVHDRCGTTFMVFVIVISILAFATVEAILGAYNITIEKVWRILLKLAMLPLVAGLSYELLKGLAKTKSPIVFPIKLPGLLLQRITTREPTLDMIEVAITAFNKVLEMDANPDIKEETFVVPLKTKFVTQSVIEKLKEHEITEQAEAEWIVSICANVKRDEVYSEKNLSPKIQDKINKIVNERITGRPLWYVIGDTEFYGYKLKVDERVLIPRPETEELVYETKKLLSENKRVLDLCTGSGAIAIALKKEMPEILVTASDISEDALTLAKENASLNNADINFVQSNLFDNIDGEFDVIVSNPPYIRSKDIDLLQKEVKDFEPRLALDGGEDGFDIYRKIAKTFRKNIVDGGTLIMEIGIGQSEELKEIFSFAETEVINDINNTQRIFKVKNVKKA